MPLKEATFWFGTLLFANGLYFWTEGGIHLTAGIVLTIVGFLMATYAVVAHHYPDKFPKLRLWVVAFVLSWAAFGYDIYDRHHPTAGWAWLWFAGIAVCAVSAAIWALAQFSSVPESKLKIHRATWGVQGAQRDVTNDLAAIARDALVLEVSFRNPALGDPAPNKHKRLDVEYSYGVEISHASVSRWGDVTSRFVLPEDTKIKSLEAELEKAKLRTYPLPLFTVEQVKPEGPATSSTVSLKNKVRIILTNHSDKNICVWTPLWESPDVHADGSPPGSTIQLAKREWQFDEWEDEKICVTVPIGRSFRSYVALLPTVEASIYRRYETKIALGTLVFPVKIDGKLYEFRTNI